MYTHCHAEGLSKGDEHPACAILAMALLPIMDKIE